MTDEVGTYSWATRTGGVLTAQQKRRLVLAVLGSFPKFGYRRFVQRSRPRRFRSWQAIDLTPVASEFASLIDTSQLQSKALLNHSIRTWLYGYALAHLDEVAGQVDPDLFYLASLFHDVGLMSPSVDECFTIRSADAAAAALEDHETAIAERVTTLRDSIVNHITPGVPGAGMARLHAAYVQEGAMADLTGARLHDLPGEVVEQALARYPRAGLADEVCGRWQADARAVKGGRAALLDRWALFGWFLSHPAPIARGD